MNEAVAVAYTRDVAQTHALAAELAALASAGDLILLAGELGAGKTAFTQGYARALGVTDTVTSPTFTLAHTYEGRLRLHHLDVYRLEHLSETLDLALSELLDEKSVTIIEWGDAITAALPADYLEMRITFGDGADDRLFELRPVGRRWLARWHMVELAVEAFPC